MPYERKTIDIYISDELKSILTEIEHESLVAHILLKKRHAKEDIVDDNVNYISLSSQDKRRISYLTSDRMESIDESEYWTSSRRYHAKPGSFLSKVFKELPAKEVEKFSNLFRSEVDKPEFTFEVVNGQRIKELYYWESYASDRGPLGISCMKHEHCQKYLDVYSDNKDNISMLAMFNRDGKLIGRALLWNFESFKLMDRIYTICDEEYSSYFKKWASKNDYLHKKEQNWFNTMAFDQFGQKPVDLRLELKLSNRNYDYYPYMDTFKFIDDGGVLYNYQPDCRFRTLCSTDGQKQGSDYLRFDSISKVFRYPGDTVWLEYLSIYTHHDNCYYSECNDRYILRDDSIYCEDARDYIFTEENESHNNREAIDSRIAYNKEREGMRNKKASTKSKISDYLGSVGSGTFNMDLESSVVFEMYNTWTERVLRRNPVEEPVIERVEDESPVVNETVNGTDNESPTEQSESRPRPGVRITRANSMWGNSYFTMNNHVVVNSDQPVDLPPRMLPAEEEIQDTSLDDAINDMLSEL